MQPTSLRKQATMANHEEGRNRRLSSAISTKSFKVDTYTMGSPSYDEMVSGAAPEAHELDPDQLVHMFDKKLEAITNMLKDYRTDEGANAKPKKEAAPAKPKKAKKPGRREISEEEAYKNEKMQKRVASAGAGASRALSELVHRYRTDAVARAELRERCKQHEKAKAEAEAALAHERALNHDFITHNKLSLHGEPGLRRARPATAPLRGSASMGAWSAGGRPPSARLLWPQTTGGSSPSPHPLGASMPPRAPEAHSHAHAALRSHPSSHLSAQGSHLSPQGSYLGAGGPPGAAGPLPGRPSGGIMHSSSTVLPSGITRLAVPPLNIAPHDGGGAPAGGGGPPSGGATQRSARSSPRDVSPSAVLLREAGVALPPPPRPPTAATVTFAARTFPPAPPSPVPPSLLQPSARPPYPTAEAGAGGQPQQQDPPHADLPAPHAQLHHHHTLLLRQAQQASFASRTRPASAASPPDPPAMPRTGQPLLASGTRAMSARSGGAGFVAARSAISRVSMRSPQEGSDEAEDFFDDGRSEFGVRSEHWMGGSTMGRDLSPESAAIEREIRLLLTSRPASGGSPTMRRRFIEQHQLLAAKRDEHLAEVKERRQQYDDWRRNRATQEAAARAESIAKEAAIKEEAWQKLLLIQRHRTMLGVCNLASKLWHIGDCVKRDRMAHPVREIRRRAARFIATWYKGVLTKRSMQAMLELQRNLKRLLAPHLAAKQAQVRKRCAERLLGFLKMAEKESGGAGAAVTAVKMYRRKITIIQGAWRVALAVRNLQSTLLQNHLFKFEKAIIKMNKRDMEVVDASRRQVIKRSTTARSHAASEKASQSMGKKSRRMTQSKEETNPAMEAALSRHVLPLSAESRKQVVDEALGEVRRHFHRRMMAYRTDKALYDAQKPIEDMRLSLLAATGLEVKPTLEAPVKPIMLCLLPRSQLKRLLYQGIQLDDVRKEKEQAAKRAEADALWAAAQAEKAEKAKSLKGVIIKPRSPRTPRK